MAMRTQVAYSPEQYARAVELWERLVDCEGVNLSEDRGYTAHIPSVEDESLYSLILSDGEETDEQYSVKVSLISYSDYGGTCADAANVRALEERYGWVNTSTDGVHGAGEAWVRLGELPPDEDGDIDWQLGQLEDLVKDIEALAAYTLIDEEKHSEYVQELAEEAWDQYLGNDVLSDLADELSNGDTWDLNSFGYSDDEIREMYYELTWEHGTGPECEGATSVRFPYHGEVIADIADRMVKAWRTPVYDPNQLSLV